MKKIVELDDVQGIIIKGYGKMPYAVYLMLHFHETEKARSWLGSLAKEVTNAATSTKNIDRAINIAFTSTGISALGLGPEVIGTFSREFREGIVAKHRQRILGDFGESDPNLWQWGGQKDNHEIHATLLLFSKTSAGLDQLISEQKIKLKATNVEILHRLDTNQLPEGKEHFGFKDGIANPVMKDTKRHEEKEHPANLINPGEFIFGYRNEYNKYPPSPGVPIDKDPDNMLRFKDKNSKDLGYNGSMLVFRQIQQDVVGFWKFLDKVSKEQKSADSGSTVEHLGSKMMGRWLDGTPMTKCPVHPERKYEAFDNFGYAENDFDGFKCPIGAHIRRANPRDNFLRNSTGNKEKDIEKSMMFMKRFRILRRGRSYGTPVSPTLDPHEVIVSDVKDKDRGLYFLCFNANIGRQFELIQQTWVNNPKFDGLYEDPDPIVGYPKIMGEGATTTFTEQAVPVRKKITGIPRFIEIKGGAYFFMPGIKVLNFLSNL